MLKDIEEGSVDVVVVYKIDRLSRSLMDFSKLVEVLDRKSVTFVSVTQSFNTTTSMGRLTLNVLLSFAQFEREVTGERIRDKFAASKKNGIWMGGNPPLGYDVASRKLVVNPAEAEAVRFIFQRYLDLGCVRLLSADLVERGMVSKHRTFGTGEKRGGKPMGRSALYCILNNRAYIGETTHKGASYPGEHKAIVPRALFDAVQQRLADLRPPVISGARSPQDAPFAGLLFDETGTAMLPTYAIKRGGLRYRYYVSRPAMRGERSRATISRIPAPPFEAFMAGVIGRLGLSGDNKEVQSRTLIQRIEIQPNSIVVQFQRAEVLALWRVANPDGIGRRDQEVIDYRRGSLARGESLADDGEGLILTLPVRARFRGGRADIIHRTSTTQPTPRPDMALIKALARAHCWRRLLLDGEVPSIEALARRVKLDRGHVGLTLNLAFLSPALTRAILRSEQPPGLRLTHLLAADIPLSWREQEALIRRAADAVGS